MAILDLEIKSIVVSVAATNCYIIRGKDAKEGILIDPGDEEEKIVKAVGDMEVSIKGIFLTHGHFDHIGAAGALASRFRVPVYAGRLEAGLMGDSYENASGFFGICVSVNPDVLLSDGESITVSGITFEVVHTPGHTKGSVCYYCREAGVLFSGDTLFFGAIGRSDLPTGNGDTLVRSIREKLLKLPSDTVVFPGHGRRTTIGYEKENNPWELFNN